MNNLLVRILTAIFAGGASVAMIWYSAWGAAAFCILISLLGLYEFYHIAGIGSRLAKWIMICGAAVLWLCWVLPLPGLEIGYLLRLNVFVELHLAKIFVAVAALACVALLFEARVRNPVTEISVLAFGYFYVLAPVYLLFLATIQSYAEASGIEGLGEGRELPGYRYEVILGVLFLVWTVDTLAYFGGKFLGKRKLWERHSPKKTWEGSVIGGISCIALSLGLEHWWPMIWSWMVVGAIVAVFSQMGDLVESMFKRGLQIKDSGGLLPGHGGILDRFDGLLISMPLIYLYIQGTIWL